MPLHDHFHPPFRRQCQWPSVHGTWVTTMLQHLNRGVLPDRYVARSQVHVGAQVEIDITAEERLANGSATANGSHGRDDITGGGVATAVRAYAPPRPFASEVVPVAAEDVFEVQVFLREGGWKLVAAIEVVSPANKNRPSARRGFARKCASLLQTGVAVVVLDVVTERAANLHAELIDLLHLPDVYEWNSPTGLSAVCYRTVQGPSESGLAVGDGRVRLDVWPHALAVGAELPTVPLWLAADTVTPLDLEATYLAAIASLRLG